MQTIGERLEEARKKKGISIREAAEATKIRGDYLQKFESNHFDIGLTEIYTRGFLRTYANFLKVPADRIMSDYAALGRGDVRPRQPNREIYGRMDITVASASEAADRAAPPEETPAAAEATPARAQPHYPRGQRSALPSGPDPATVFKWVKIGSIIAVAIIVLWVAKSLFTSGNRTPRSQASTTAPAPSNAVQPAAQPAGPTEYTITLIATETVFIRIMHYSGLDTDTDEVWQGTLNRGERKTISFLPPVNIYASAGQNLSVEFPDGRRFGTGFTGYGHVQLTGKK
jgi:cytoskeleton protein RodZ